MHLCWLYYIIEMCLDGIWWSGWNESCEGLLVVTDVSTSWAESIFRMKWRMLLYFGLHCEMNQSPLTILTTNRINLTTTNHDAFHPDDQIQSKYVTPGLKPFSILRNARLFLYLPYLQSRGKGTYTTSPSVWTPWACKAENEILKEKRKNNCMVD